MKKENSISRRSFLKSSALAGALGAIGTGSTVGVLTSCGGGESANAIKPLKEPGTYYVPELLERCERRYDRGFRRYVPRTCR